MWIDVNRVTPTQVNAVVSGSTAAFNLDYAVCDLVKTGTRWRIVLDLGAAEIALLVGKFERYDG